MLFFNDVPKSFYEAKGVSPYEKQTDCKIKSWLIIIIVEFTVLSEVGTWYSTYGNLKN